MLVFRRAWARWGLAIVVLCLTGIACVVKQPITESKKASLGGGNNDDAMQQRKLQSQQCMKLLYRDVKHNMQEKPGNFSVDDEYGLVAGKLFNQLDSSAKQAQRAAKAVDLSYYEYEQYTSDGSVNLLMAIEDDVCYCLQTSKVMTHITEREIASKSSLGEDGKHRHLRFELRNNHDEVEDSIEFDTDTNMIVISRHNNSCTELEFRVNSGDFGTSNSLSTGAEVWQQIKLDMSAEAGSRFSAID